MSATHKQEKSPSFRNVHDTCEYVYMGNHVNAYTY